MATAEVRFQFYDIHTDLYWREITTGDIALLNAARAAHGLPVLTFVAYAVPMPTATWTPAVMRSPDASLT